MWLGDFTVTKVSGFTGDGVTSEAAQDTQKSRTEHQSTDMAGNSSTC